ncbi:uncharacterized protein LOC128327395 [Hemicordylus capensis]|uniref:uncharacterized protein LOC128327395 n=1 Tax=Hemicordylus capensis TaxID=884348 RepID=UPI002303F842|nr:uncharacterized protein LOC128327395 [Hemicordylus capensis]
MILVYVDDLLVLVQCEQQRKKIEAELGRVFTLKSLGIIKTYIGMHIEHTRKGYILIQNSKITQMLKECNLEQCKTVETPMVANFLGEESCDSEPFEDVELYQSIIGKLLYLSQWSRPDILTAVNILSRFSSKPTKRHWVGVKRILRYLKGTIDKGMYLEPDEDLKLDACVDSDWAGDIHDRKSTSGYIVLLGGCLVGWKTRK